MRHLRWLLPLALVALSFGLRYDSLNQTPFVNGSDGYYYLVQLQSWVEEGTMHSPEYSPVYPAMRVALALSGSYEQAFKLSAAAFAGLFTLFIWLFALQYSRRIPTAFLAAAFTVFSPSLTWMAAQFPKNLLGMVGVAAFAWMLSRKSLFGQGIAILFSGVTHKLSGGISLLWFVFQRLSLKVILIGAGLAAVLILAGIFHFSEFERFSGTLQSAPQLPQISFIQTLEVSPLWRAEIWLALGIWLWNVVEGVRRREKMGWVLAIAFLWLPWWQMDPGSMGYRFFMAGMILAPVGLAIRVQARRSLTAVCLAIACSFLAFPARQSYDPGRHDPDYGYLQRVAATATEKVRPELFICHSPLAEVITFHQGIDALPWLPEYAVPDSALWRIAADIDTEEVRYYLGNEAEWYPLSDYYLLLKESDWEIIRQKSEDANDEYLLNRIYSDQNPYKIRPDFLLRRK